MYPIQTLEKAFLSDLIYHRKPVTLYLNDGTKLKGIVTGMTEEIIFFQDVILKAFSKKRVKCIIPIGISTA